MKHVFISFAHANAEQANAISDGLVAAGIPIWIDHTSLEPGSVDWEQAIRDAMADSFAVVYVASPEARQSRFVKGELVLASVKKLKIFPIWISGQEWDQAAPIELLHTQYIDARSEGRGTEIKRLVELIKKEMQQDLPDIMEVNDPWIERNSGTEFKHAVRRIKEPLGYFSVDLCALNDNSKTARPWNKCMFAKPSRFATVGELLDEVYMRYLSQEFLPFTYGVDWVLRSSRARWAQTHLILPPQPIAKTIDARIEQASAYRALGLKDAKITPDSKWEVIRMSAAKPCIVATLDEHTMDGFFRANAKTIYALLLCGAFISGNISDVPSSMIYRATFDMSAGSFLRDYIKPNEDNWSVIYQTDDSVLLKHLIKLEF